MKPSAAEPRLLKHAGPALVFRDYNDMAARIDRDDLEVTPDHVLVLQNAGPVGGPGMPEWGMLPIPKKLLKQGVRDMLRISDARMSGTSYGACILHVAPESYIGGPLAAVRTGDIIRVRRRAPVARPRSARKRDRPPPRRMEAARTQFPRGYNRLFAEHIRQADKGCDFDFLFRALTSPFSWSPRVRGDGRFRGTQAIRPGDSAAPERTGAAVRPSRLARSALAPQDEEVGAMSTTDRSAPRVTFHPP